MRQSLQIGVVLVAVVLLGSCTMIRTHVDRDETVDFGAFDDYAWFQRASSPELGRPGGTANDIVERRIRQAVSDELGREGLTATEPEEADLLVTYHVALRQRIVLYSGGWGHPYPGWWGWGHGYASGRSYTEGTLVVDVLERSSRRLVWRGIAEGAFQRPNPTQEHVSMVVSKLMANFPG